MQDIITKDMVSYYASIQHKSCEEPVKDKGITGIVAVEDINIQGMERNYHIAKSKQIRDIISSGRCSSINCSGGMHDRNINVQSIIEDVFNMWKHKAWPETPRPNIPL